MLSQQGQRSGLDVLGGDGMKAARTVETRTYQGAGDEQAEEVRGYLDLIRESIGADALSGVEGVSVEGALVDVVYWTDSDSKTIEDVAATCGPLGPTDLVPFALRLLSLVQSVHARGVGLGLRGIDPSEVVVRAMHGKLDVGVVCPGWARVRMLQAGRGCTEADDILGLGALFTWMLTGERMPSASTVARRASDAGELARVLSCMVDEASPQRLTDAGTVLESLVDAVPPRLLTSKAVRAWPSITTSPMLTVTAPEAHVAEPPMAETHVAEPQVVSLPAERSSRAGFGIAAALVALLAGAGLLWAWSADDEESPSAAGTGESVVAKRAHDEIAVGLPDHAPGEPSSASSEATPADLTPQTGPDDGSEGNPSVAVAVASPESDERVTDTRGRGKRRARRGRSRKPSPEPSGGAPEEQAADPVESHSSEALLPSKEETQESVASPFLPLSQ